MDFQLLRAFVDVAAVRRFSAAAKRQRLSQPALSRQIRALERELGFELFVRGPQGVTLTDKGQSFHPLAIELLAKVRATEDGVRGIRGEMGRTLRVGYSGSHRRLVGGALGRVLRSAALLGVRIRADEAITDHVAHRVVEGKLDVGLTYAPQRMEGLETEDVLERPLRLLRAARKRNAGLRSIELKTLSEPFALLRRGGMSTRRHIDDYFMRQKFEPNILIESNAIALILSVVREGRAVTIFSDPEDAESGLEVLALSPAPDPVRSVLLWRRGAPRSPAARMFASAVIELATTAASFT